MDPAARYLTATYLVAWSATTISAESASHCAMSRVEARLAGPEKVRHAAAAQARVLRVRPDFGAVVPAALALRVRTRVDVDAHPGQCAADGVRRRAVLDPRLRSDEHEPQIIRERTQ